MSLYRPPRREFLLRALTACGASLLVPPAHVQGGQRPQPAAGSDRGKRIAARYLGPVDLDAAQTIGEAYLRHLDIEDSVESIMTAAGNALLLIVRSPDEAAAVTALIEAVRRDFREERTVQLAGWVLSRTEVELCLLTRLPDRK